MALFGGKRKAKKKQEQEPVLSKVPTEEDVQALKQRQKTQKPTLDEIRDFDEPMEQLPPARQQYRQEQPPQPPQQSEEFVNEYGEGEEEMVEEDLTDEEKRIAELNREEENLRRRITEIKKKQEQRKRERQQTQSQSSQGQPQQVAVRIRAVSNSDMLNHLAERLELIETYLARLDPILKEKL